MEERVLKQYLIEGKSLREIGKLVGVSYKTISYYVKKFNLHEYQNYPKLQYNEEFFHKIDTKEKAYILGFLLGDCSLSDEQLEISVALKDREVVEFIAEKLQAKTRYYNRLDVDKKQFPKARVTICNKLIIRDLKRLFGGTSKEDRHIPIIPPKLEKYLLKGFFDADGCITWGRRKDRDRLWHKVSFTSQYKMLVGIQNILLKNGIPSAIRPKSKEKCFIIEFANRGAIVKFLDFIYNDDFVVLKRKYEKATALRLELGEFGGSLNSHQ